MFNNKYTPEKRILTIYMSFFLFRSFHSRVIFSSSVLFLVFGRTCVTHMHCIINIRVSTHELSQWVFLSFMRLMFDSQLSIYKYLKNKRETKYTFTYTCVFLLLFFFSLSLSLAHTRSPSLFTFPQSGYHRFSLVSADVFDFACCHRNCIRKYVRLGQNNNNQNINKDNTEELWAFWGWRRLSFTKTSHLMRVTRSHKVTNRPSTEASKNGGGRWIYVNVWLKSGVRSS